MSPSRRHLVMAGMLAGLTATAIAAPDTYSAAPISGRVIDADTGAPIAGAVVVADWTIWQRGLLPLRASERFRRFEVQEALTDAEGRYRMPGWGPIDRPTGWDIHPRGVDDPRLAVFKPGYDPEFRNNNKPGVEGDEPFNRPEAAVRLSAWDGKDIALHKFGTFDRRTPGLVDPAYQGYTPRQQSLDRLNGFKSTVDHNVNAADGEDAPPDSQRRQLFIQRQRQAILMIDEELTRITGRAFDPNRWTSAGIEDYVRQQRQRGSSK